MSPSVNGGDSGPASDSAADAVDSGKPSPGEPGGPPIAPEGARNLVVIMVDDLDSRSLGQLLAGAHMPHLRTHIIDAGLTLEEAFVTNSLCCPSRATLLSGQYSHNHHVYSNADGYRAFLPHDQNTVAVRLHDAGYRTAHVGKYLNGYDDRNYVAPGWDEWHTTLDGSTYNIYEYNIVESVDGSSPRLVQPGTYQTDELAQRATSFIASATAQPFFLVVMPLAPHVEVLPGQRFGNFAEMYKLRIRPAPRHVGSLRAPDGAGGYIEDQPLNADFDLPGRALASFNEADLSDKPSWLRTGPNGTEGAWPLLDAGLERDLRVQHLDRLESMLAVDDLVGQVFDALQARDIVDETLVIFTSDNGFFLGEHRLNNKMFPYEEGLRVPLYIRAPDAADAGSVSTRMVLNNDLAPTLCDYGGVLDGWDIDGRSLRPLLRGEMSARWRKRFLLEHWYLRVNANGQLQYNDLPDYYAVRTGPQDAVSSQIYVEYTRSGEAPGYDRSEAAFETEHYDLEKDPAQAASVHDDPDYDRARTTLKHQLDALGICAGAACRDAEDL